RLGPAHLDQELDIARERAAGKGAARTEVRPRADTDVALESPLDLARIGADGLAERRQLVGEGDRRGQEGVERVLGHLRRLDRHPLDPVREWLEEPADPVAVGLMADAGDDPGRPGEGIDRLAKPEVLGPTGERRLSRS